MNKEKKDGGGKKLDKETFRVKDEGIAVKIDVSSYSKDYTKPIDGA